MPIDLNTEMTTPALDRGEGIRTSHAAPHPDPAHALPAPRRSYTAVWIALGVVLVLLVIGIVSGIVSRSVTERHLEQTTVRDAVLSVNVTHPGTTGGASEIS